LALEQIRTHHGFQCYGLSLDAKSVPEAWTSGSYADMIQAIVQRYATAVGKQNRRFWIDHTPSNINFARTLLELFPTAKMIHIVRDGRGVAASVMPLDWGPNSIVAAARWWVSSVSYGLAAESNLGERILRISYESLVRQPVSTCKRLVEFIGIEYDKAMAEGSGFMVPSYTARQHAYVGSAPRVSRIDAWKQALSPRQVEIFESETGDFLRYLGYPLDYRGLPRRTTVAEKARSTLVELVVGNTLKRMQHLRRQRRHAA
jgi:hypothetical protein